MVKKRLVASSLLLFAILNSVGCSHNMIYLSCTEAFYSNYDPYKQELTPVYRNFGSGGLFPLPTAAIDIDVNNNKALVSFLLDEAELKIDYRTIIITTLDKNKSILNTITIDRSNNFYERKSELRHKNGDKIETISTTEYFGFCGLRDGNKDIMLR